MGIFDRIAGQLGDLIAPDEVRDRVARAEAALAAGDLDGAIVELSLSLRRAPDHARAAHLLGVALLRKHELAGAEQALTQATSIREGYAEAEAALGEVLRRRGRGAEALERFRRALAAGAGAPTLLAEAYRGRGAVHLDEGRADKAVRELRKAIAALPADAESNRLLGLSLIARGGPTDLDLARVCFEKAWAALAGGSDEETVDATGPSLPPTTTATSTDGETTTSEAGAIGSGEAALVGAVAARSRALVLLAEVYRRLDRRAEARTRLERARAIFDTPPSRIVAARLALDEGDAPAARGEAAAALAATEGAWANSTNSEPWQLSARVLFGTARLAVAARRELARAAARSGDCEGALAALDQAVADEASPAMRSTLTDEALRLALRAGRDEAAAAWAERLLAIGGEASVAPGEATPPSRSTALAALAARALARGDATHAANLLDEIAASTERDGLEPRLVDARIAHARGERARAAAIYRSLAERFPDEERPRARLAALYRDGHEAAASDLYTLLALAQRRLRDTPETSDLAPEAARVLEILDRPLLLGVMGEFNAGKSTFVNALVGEQVAPMGITPTTATINVLRYGAERGGRVVYRDDTIRHVPWAEVPDLLRGLDDAEAARIRYVEVLYPHETLQRVNIVDTPGLNSVRPEHEATAREFVAQADAIVWLFSCRQAGTASEHEALERIREAGRRVLGVVNQIDLVDDEEERARLLAHLAAGFGPLVEALVPLSARDALLGAAAGDTARLRRSNREALDRELEARFFGRAKAIKREAAATRLRPLLDEARRRGEARLVAAGGADAGRGLAVGSAIAEAGQALSRSRARFLGPFLDEERRRAIERLGDLYAQAAQEIVEFVRPRRWPFGENEAQRADRDFLVGLIEQQLSQLTEDARCRVERAARAEAAPLLALAPPEAEPLLEAALVRLDGAVYGRYRAFSRGFLRGGRVDDFFTRVLPRIELEPAALSRALLRDMPALAVLDEELCAPLAAWARELHDALDARLARLARTEELARLEIEERLVLPFASLLAQLAPHLPEPTAKAAPGATHG